MAVSISKERFEQALKFSHKSKSGLAREVIDRYSLATKPDSMVVTIRRAVRKGMMDNELLEECSDIMDVSPLYLQGIQTIPANKKHPKQRIDDNGNYIASYNSYLVKEVLPPILKASFRYIGDTYLNYIFEKYEITSKDGVRYEYKEILPERLEEVIVNALNNHFQQWDYGKIPYIAKWAVHENGEEK